MKRSKPLPRRTPLARSPMKRKARPASETTRIYGPPARRKWVKSLPCFACGLVGASENAHVGTEGKGVGRKANADQIIPLCGRGAGNGCHWKFDHHRDPFDGLVYRAAAVAYAAVVEQMWQRKSQGNPEHISGPLGRVLANLFTDDGDAA